MIPEAAVEAAAKGLSITTYDNWGDAPDHVQRRYLSDARAALEAAAPHMLAGVEAAAWEAGFDRGFYDPLAGSSRDASESLARNPYE